MSLVDFYTKILKEVGIEVTTDGFLQAEQDGEMKLLKRTKRHLEIGLPKKELLDNMFVLNENNKYIQNYLLFNPLCEKSIEDGVGLEILKDFVTRKFSIALLGLGNLLISLYDAPTLQGDLPMDINLFLKDLKDTNIPGMKGSGKPVDKTSLDKWVKFVVSYIDSVDKQLFNLIIPRTKKAAVKDSPTREARLTLTMLNELKEVAGTDEAVEINGIKLRPKEVKVFTDICAMFMDGCNSKGCITVATNDVEAPGFISLMTLFFKLMSRINKLVKSMREVDPAVADDVVAILNYDINEIENAPIKYKQELLMIPTENEINVGVTVANGSNKMNTNIRNIHQGLQTAIQSTQQPVQQEVAPFEPDAPKTTMDAMLDRIAQRNQHAMHMGARPPMGMMQSRPLQTIGQPMTNNGIVAAPPPTGSVNSVRTVSRFAPQFNTPETMAMLNQENAMMQTRPAMGYGYPTSPMYPQPMMPQTGQVGVAGIYPNNQWQGGGYPPMQQNGWGWPRRY